MIENRIQLMRSAIEITPDIPSETKAELSIQGLDDSNVVFIGAVNRFATASPNMGL